MSVTLRIDVAHGTRCVICGTALGAEGVPVDIREARDVGNPLLIFDRVCPVHLGGGDDGGGGALPRAGVSLEAQG